MFRKKPSRKIVLQFADTHGGHLLGLLNPDVELYDEDEWGNPRTYRPELTATQEYLWQCYNEDLDRVERLADGAPIIVVHDGDLAHGDKYPEQLVSSRKADQVAIAVANMERALELPNILAVRLLEGTGAHEFSEGTIALLVAAQLRAVHPQLDTAFRRHILLSVDGVRFDCAHHGPSPGIRAWTSGNQLRYYARSIMYDALADGEEPPDAITRAHRHLMRHETVRIHTKRGTFKTEAIILPSYCGLSGHARQSTQSDYRITTGMVAYEVEGGRLREVYPFWRMVDLRTRETL
jgi:hypothetical protein